MESCVYNDSLFKTRFSFLLVLDKYFAWNYVFKNFDNCGNYFTKNKQN